jgi:hypothetical protein
MLPRHVAQFQLSPAQALHLQPERLHEPLAQQMDHSALLGVTASLGWASRFAASRLP